MTHPSAYHPAKSHPSISHPFIKTSAFKSFFLFGLMGFALLLVQHTANAGPTDASASARTTEAKTTTESTNLTKLTNISKSTNTVQSTLPSIREKTAGMEKFDGFFTFWRDEAADKIWLEIDRLDEQFLYVNALAAGIGSNDIGLDRSQLGNTRIVSFRRIGPKVMMIQPNLGYRATSGVPLEAKSVEEAFAQSVLFGFEVAAEEDGRILVDLTPFLMQDAHGVSERLRSSGQGSYSIDASRSAIHMPGTFNFPKNSEFEAMLTFKGSGAGRWLRSVAPSDDAVTVRMHHSFVELPDDNYKPRAFDPRSGYYATSYQDYSSPIGEPLTTRYIVRHRLEKKDPSAERSEAVEPIIYYLDNGTPEPIRTALLEGGRWWNQAFEAAGYIDAFQVKMLPDDAHPLDIRYNVINWVHRSTRGWSYGSSVSDPRTGEIIKGNVLLGSLRVRQDYMIAEGLLAPYAENDAGDLDPNINPAMLEMALHRIRQLSAHEIGHTLGLMHNFSSSVNDLASVMDYPHPRPTLTNGENSPITLNNAYGTGIGEWDKRAIIWGYQDFSDDANEQEELDAIMQETLESGLFYLSDEAARPQGGSDSRAHLWDYGTDAPTQMDHIMDIRRTALDRFGENNIRMGRPVSDLQNVLVPIYLFHRYQTEAVVKLIGGVDFAYTVRGDGQAGPTVVSPGQQRAALTAILRTLDPAELALPEHLLDLIPPPPAGIGTTREQFQGYTTPQLDPVAMAETVAQLTAGLLFQENRAARLALQSARDASQVSLQEMIRTVLDQTIRADMPDGYEGAIQRAINTAVMRSFLGLALDTSAAPDVQAVTAMNLYNLMDWLEEATEELEDTLETTEMEEWESDRLHTQISHYVHLASMIDRATDEPEDFVAPDAPYTPPGSPIGSGVMHDSGATSVFHCSAHSGSF